ncbi:MAG: succinate dehydrogenase, hydrophobic membrane anchor protein [Pseudoclavibacter sp.]
MTIDTIEYPRTPVSQRRGPNLEKAGWMFMRVSGVLLVILILGHLFVNLMLGDGISAIDFAFVGGKLSSPFWQVWDGLMLVLALIHGTNGLRTIVNDYVARAGTRRTLEILLYIVCVALIVLGLLVIFTFDPCPAGAPADLLPSFCPA